MIVEKFRRAGGVNLAAAISEERETIEDGIEPFLIQQGYAAPVAACMAIRRARTGTAGATGRDDGTGGAGFTGTPQAAFSIPVLRLLCEDTDVGAVVITPTTRVHRTRPQRPHITRGTELDRDPARAECRVCGASSRPTTTCSRHLWQPKLTVTAEPTEAGASRMVIRLLSASRDTVPTEKNCCRGDGHSSVYRR